MNVRDLLRMMSPDATGDAYAMERGQALLRVVIGIFVWGYIAFWQHGLDVYLQPASWPPALWIATAFFITGNLIFVWCIRSGHYSKPRRILAQFHDPLFIGLAVPFLGEHSPLWLFLYIWISIGNGFRFGPNALKISAIASACSFAGAVYFSPYWQSMPYMVASWVLTLTVSPYYLHKGLSLLVSALRRAEEANRAKSEFLARMSHELRTPINGIVGSLELLEAQSPLTPAQRELVGVIRSSVEVSLRQIANVLDFAKIEAAKLQIADERFDLHKTLKTVVAMLRPVADKKGVPLVLRVDMNAPWDVIGDEHHLQQVLLNLLNNAIKFTDRGYVCLEVAVARPIDDASEVATLRFEIIDTGIGIKQEALAGIFDAFNQENPTISPQYGGTGLGTAISRQLVELMGGHIGVTSEKGRGSIFWFDLPLALPSDRATELSVPPGRVLLATGDNAFAAGVRALLDPSGTHLDGTTSREEATARLQRSLRVGDPPQILLLDSQLAFSPDGRHEMAGLCAQAIAAGVPTALVADHSLPATRLREWGYATVLPRQLTTTLVARLLHFGMTFVPRTATSDAGAPKSLVNLTPILASRQAGQAAQARILVADDNATNLMIEQKRLSQAGYDVDTARDGEEALQKLLANSYDLAVLDLRMPGLLGTEVAQQYRQLLGPKGIPIIILTADGTVNARTASSDAGVDAFVTKPARGPDLLGQIHRLLTERHVRRIPRLPPSPVARAAGEGAQLNTTILRDIASLYGQTPEDRQELIELFSRDAGSALARLEAACAAGHHNEWCEIAYALRGAAAAIGATTLMHRAQDATAMGLNEFRTNSKTLLNQLRTDYNDAKAELEGFFSDKLMPE